MTSVGLCLPQLGPHVTRSCVREFCASAEDLGFGGLWAQEHLFYPLDPPSGYHQIEGVSIPEQYQSVFSPLELLSCAAAWTQTVTIGTSMLVAGYHRPVEIAGRLATLDRLSGGRLVAGFSVGWSDEEHALMDVDPRSRGSRSEELIEAILTCWGPDPVAFQGRFFQIPPSLINPKPLQRPHPTLLSGMASARGRERTTRLFDAWNPSGAADRAADSLARLNVVRPAERDPLDIYLRVFAEPPPGRLPEPADLEDMVRECQRAVELGFAGLIIDCNFWSEIRSADDWRKVPSRIAGLLEDLLKPATGRESMRWPAPGCGTC